MRLSRLALCLAALAAVVALSACGGDEADDVPADAVATVDGAPLPQEEFDRWLAVVVRSSQPPGTGAKPAVPVPPDFTACVAAKKKQKPAKGQPRRSDAALKSECQREYQAARNQVMQILITGAWLEGEAEKLDVKVTDKEAKKRSDEQLKAQFPKKKDREKFLEESGLTEAELIYQQKLTLLSEKIREKVVSGSDNVKTADIKKYYDENKAQFSQPETRDISVVLTRKKAEADEAKRRLEAGESFEEVAKDLSVDETSKDAGGKLPGIAEGQLEAALDKAVFGAKKGEIEGPVKTEFGYYVFRVDKITKATEQSFKQAQEQAKQLLISERENEKLNSFVEEFQQEWRDVTVCADGFLVPECKNGPDPPEQPEQGGGEPPSQ